MNEQEEIARDVEAALAERGLDLLEFGLSRHRGSTQVRAVVHAAGGTGTDECSKAHRLIVARLAEAHGIVEPFVEVSSPGIDRLLKSGREYGIFAGERLRILLVGESEWRRGRLAGLADGIVSMDTGEGRLDVPLAEIAKARLDSTSEGD